jgi:threonine dehydrogenase-like Zn-dependent dehydrogenase
VPRRARSDLPNGIYHVTNRGTDERPIYLDDIVTALEIARPGGAAGWVGVPQEETTPASVAFWKNVSIGGGPAPARAYIEELLPDVLAGRIEPGRVFGRTSSLDDAPDGYRAMNERESIKFLIEL